MLMLKIQQHKRYMFFDNDNKHRINLGKQLIIPPEFQHGS
jgi:hypothetical protein